MFVGLLLEKMEQMLEKRGLGKSRRMHGIVSWRRLFCCSCRQTDEKDSCLSFEHHGENMSTSGGDRESVHIIVEDLGLDNPNFTLPEAEDYVPDHRTAVGRSASSVSSCQRSLKKRKLAPLSSMPLQSRTTQGSLNSEEYDSAVDSLLFGTGSGSDGGLLTPPVINLIPPTPSDVIDDDQFFDINSEEDSVAHTSGSEGVDSMGSVAPGDQESEEEEEEDEKPDQDVGPEELKPTKAMEKIPEVELKEEANVSKEEKLEQNKVNFLRKYFQVAPLPEYPRKSKHL